jgi:alkylation response protein AidB-like acyl-CoA dehydrogenase
MHELGLNDEQDELARSVGQLCTAVRDEILDAGARPADLVPRRAWAQLAQLGVLGIGSTEGGGAKDIAAAFEPLGAGLFSGPLVDTMFAAHVLEPTARDEVVAGVALAALVVPGLPMMAEVQWRLSLNGGNVTVLDERSGSSLVSSAPAVAFAQTDVAAGAYAIGLGRRCVALAAEHAASRRQFGKALGEFQAVSHALARCEAALQTSRALLLQSATSWDRGDHGAATSVTLAAAASNRAAIDATLVSHQVFGAMGFSVEGEIWRYSTRARLGSVSWPSATRVAAAASAMTAGLAVRTTA